jgi:hypothetical protein
VLGFVAPTLPDGQAGQYHITTNRTAVPFGFQPHGSVGSSPTAPSKSVARNGTFCLVTAAALPVEGERMRGVIERRAQELGRTLAEVERSYTEATVLKPFLCGPRTWPSWWLTWPHRRGTT